MIDKEFMHRQNVILFYLLIVFYCIQIIINIFFEGLASVIPTAFLFVLAGIILIQFILIRRRVNPKVTMYALVSCMYIYFYFLLNESPYLVIYFTMWLGLPLCAIYQSKRVVIIAGMASIFLSFHSFFYLHEEIFPNVVHGDFVYLVLFGVFMTAFQLIFIQMIRKANNKLQELAYHDPLTGVANRLLLKKQFDLLKDTKVDSIALLFIDMNGFKRINDTYGHDVGDQLLERVVAKINGVLRETDLLCRLGGDEFLILSSNIDHFELECLSERIQQALDMPMVINQKKIKASASIGWAWTSDLLVADLDNMIREADGAMYMVKGNGEIKS